jgi:hypothetical protein
LQIGWSAESSITLNIRRLNLSIDPQRDVVSLCLPLCPLDADISEVISSVRLDDIVITSTDERLNLEGLEQFKLLDIITSSHKGFLMSALEGEMSEPRKACHTTIDSRKDQYDTFGIKLITTVLRRLVQR